MEKSFLIGVQHEEFLSPQTVQLILKLKVKRVGIEFPKSLLEEKILENPQKYGSYIKYWAFLADALQKKRN